MKGGIGDYTRLLANALVDQGVRVSLVVPAGAAQDQCLAPIAAMFDRWSWSAARLVHRTLVATGADWLHLQHNGGMYKSSRLAAYFLPRYLRWKRWRGRIAVTFHDINRPPLFPRAGVLRDWVLADLARRSDVVIAADTGDVEVLRSWGAPVRQIPIGANIPTSVATATTLEKVRDRYRIPAGALLIVHFGTASGLDTLLEVVSRLPHAILLLVGKTEERGHPGAINILADAMHDQIASLGLTPRLRWTGHLPDQDVADALAASDVLVLPYAKGASMRHGGLLACLAQGRPVITTESRWEMPGFKPGETFLMVPPSDSAALIQAIEAVATDQALRDRLARGANAVRHVFLWNRIACQHRQLYEGLPGSANPVRTTAEMNAGSPQDGLASCQP